MKKKYSAPKTVSVVLNMESPLMEYSNHETKSPYEDIPNNGNGLFNGKNQYQEGDGEDAG